MSNLRNIQFFRNGGYYASLSAAKTALASKIDVLLDGSPIIGRYKYTDSSGVESIKSVIGIAHKNISGTTDITFFESANDIADTIARLQSEMDTTQTTVGTNADGTKIDQTESKFISGKTTIEAEIKALNDVLEALEYEKTVDDNKIFSYIKQEDGQITTNEKNITEVKLAGYAEGTDADIAATDTLGQALGKLQAQINAMDKNASAVDGQVVTTVSEADGKVTETKANVKDLQLGGYAKTNDTGAIASDDTINVALSKIENQMVANDVENADGSINISAGTSGGTDINVNIKEGEHVLAKDGGSGLYTNIAISAATAEEVTTLGVNVKEAYKLVGTDGTRLGDYVKIYRDSALKEIYLGSSADTIDTTSGVITKETVTDPQSLNYAYQLADGTYTLVKIDVSKFLTESEFASGVTQNGAGVVTGVVDGTSEQVITAYSTESGNTTANVLSVGANGFKVSNIQNAINAAVGKAQTTINTAVTSTDETTSHLSIAETVADDGSKSYAFTTNDIASEDALDAEVTRAKAAEAALDSVLGSVKGDNETRTWTKTGTHYIGSGPTVLADVTKLDEELFALSSKTATDFTSNNGSIDIATAATTSGTVTVDLQTDADNISGLTAVASSDEGRAKLSGVTATDTVKTGIKNLYDSLASEIAARKAAILARTITGSNAINVTETPNGDGFNSTITLTLDATTVGNGDEKTGADNALTITSNGLFLSNTWECGTFND